jgi:hypothetical protein
MTAPATGQCPSEAPVLTDHEQWALKQKEKGAVTVRIKTVPEALRNLPRPPVSTLFCLRHEGEVLPVLHGDRFEKRSRYTCSVWVQAPDGQLVCVQAPQEAEFVQGSQRKVYFPSRPFAGTSSMMAVVGRGINRRWGKGGHFG